MADDRQLAEIWRTQYTGPLFRKYAGLEQVPEASIGYLARQSRLAVDFCQTMMAPLGLKQYAVNTPLSLPSGEIGMMRTHVIAGFGGTPIVTTRVELTRKVVEKKKKKKKKEESYPLFFYYDPSDGKKAIIEYREGEFTVITADSEGGQEQLDAIQIEFAQNSSYYFWTGISSDEVAIVVNTPTSEDPRQTSAPYISKLYGAGGVLIKELESNAGYYGAFMKNGVYYVDGYFNLSKIVDGEEVPVYSVGEYWMHETNKEATKIIYESMDYFKEVIIDDDGTFRDGTVTERLIEKIDELDSDCDEDWQADLTCTYWHEDRLVKDIQDMWFNADGDVEQMIRVDHYKEDTTRTKESDNSGNDGGLAHYATVTYTISEQNDYYPRITLGDYFEWYGSVNYDGEWDGYSWYQTGNKAHAAYPKFDVFVYGTRLYTDYVGIDTNALTTPYRIYKLEEPLYTFEESSDFEYEGNDRIWHDAEAHNNDGALVFSIALNNEETGEEYYRIFGYYKDEITEITELINPNPARYNINHYNGTHGHLLLAPLRATMANTVITEEETV